MAKRWRKKMGRVSDFIFLGSKITEDGDSSHEIKRHLLLGRKAVIKLGRILNKRQRHYFPTEVCHCFHCFAIFYREVVELDAMIFVF